MRTTLFTLMICCLITLSAQAQCYNDTKSKAASLAQQKKYDSAIKQLQWALNNCPEVKGNTARENEFKALIKKYRETIAPKPSPGSEKSSKGGSQTDRSFLRVNGHSASFSKSLDASGGQAYFEVTCSGSFEVKDLPDWCFRGGNTSEGFYIDYGENGSGLERTGAIVVAGANKNFRIMVSQPAKLITLSVSPQSLSFTAAGGTRTVTITTNGTWDIGTDTYSWGHLTKDGNQVKVRIDENTGTESRTDYFTIKAGGVEKRVEISQAGGTPKWEVSGTSRNYTDNASALSFITSKIKEKGECRLGAITEYGKGIVIYGIDGGIWSSIPTSFSDKIKEIDKKINSVALTNSGYYCVVYDENAWFGHVPEGMKNKLNEFNSNAEEIWSVSISENGDYAIVTNKHYSASNNSDHSNIKKASELYGMVKDVCITDKGICVVCQNGIYYSNIPTNIESKLKSTNMHPDHVTFTDSGTYLITTEAGKYEYHM